MYKAFRTTILATVAALTAATSFAQNKLDYKVIHGSSFNNVNATIIYGDKECALIDGGLFNSDAYRIIAALWDLHKSPTTVYITHPDGDHYLGIQMLRNAFPAMKVVSLPNIAAAINNGKQQTLNMWYNMMKGKENLPTDIVTVESIGTNDGAELMVDGNKIEITGNQQGDLNPSSFVWVPSLKLVCSGDIVYSGSYPWTGGSTPESRAKWLQSVERITKLKPAIVVPGHMDPTYSFSPASLTFMKQYLTYYNIQRKLAKDGADFLARIKKKYIFKVSDFALMFDVNTAYPKK